MEMFPVRGDGAVSDDKCSLKSRNKCWDHRHCVEFILIMKIHRGR